MTIKKNDFDKFFKPYAKSVDKANEGYFWILNNRIITEIIKLHIPVGTSRDKTILDAGGGTGRWICDLAKIYKTQFILYDLSGDMLTVAEKNIKRAGIENRVRIVKGNLENMKSVASNSVDYIISIYNPISFVNDKDKAIHEMYRILKKNGLIIVMGQGFYNALYSKINNFLAPPEEIKMMDKKSLVKWDKQTPDLHVFTQESLEKILESKSFKIIESYGVPVFTQPGPEDFGNEDPNKSRISQALMKKDFFDTIVKIEMKYNSLPTVVNRGMNIVTIAKK